MKKLVVLLSFMTILLLNCVLLESIHYVTEDYSILKKENMLVLDDPINPKGYKKNRYFWL